MTAHEWEWTEGDVWYPVRWWCRRCGSVISHRVDDGMPPDEVARNAGVDPDCDAQMVKNVMSE